MKTIIVLNDGSAAAEHAAKMALNIAQKVNADLLLANTFKEWRLVSVEEKVLISAGYEGNAGLKRKSTLIDKLTSLSHSQNSDFQPQISAVDASESTTANIAQLINKNNIWMIVKGISETANTNPVNSFIDIQFVLNKVMCPLLLVPPKYEIKELERIVYLADLRYCQLPVVRYLAQLAKPYHAKLQIAHVSAKGLPDMQENYAHTFFSEAISSCVKYDNLFFNNIKEKSLQKVADVMINGMHTDLLVLVNRQFHFEELIGSYITATLPDHITIPLLIFPC
jgi:nucleotide-binding universal stress UspA family protein